jgi:hypothetical protein
MADVTADSEWLELFVPGRLCVLGEHSDWAGGFRRMNPVSLVFVVFGDRVASMVSQLLSNKLTYYLVACKQSHSLTVAERCNNHYSCLSALSLSLSFTVLLRCTILLHVC